MSRLRPLPWRWRLPAFAAGLLLGEAAIASGGRVLPRLVVAAVLLGPAVARRHRAAGVGSLLAGAGALFGLLLGAPRTPPPRAAGEEAACRLVAAITDIRPLPGFAGQAAASLQLEVESILEGDQGIRSGDRLRLRIRDIRGTWSPGDRIAVRVEARRPRGRCNEGRDEVADQASRSGVEWTADAGDDRSLERLGRAHGGRAWLARARHRVASAIDDASSPQAAPVLRSIVVGDSRGLDPVLRQAYARTGTTHVLSISGLHVAIVVSSSMLLARIWLGCSLRLATIVAPVRLAAGLAVAPAVGYVLLAGAAIPAIRSLAAGLVFACAVMLRRRGDAGTALAAGATWIGATDPAACLDPSFQLSFGAVVAIASGLRAIQGGCLAWLVSAPPQAGPARRAGAVLGHALAVSACAAVGTAPITACHFGTISAAGVVTNVVVVPLVGWVALVAGLFGTALLAVHPGSSSLAFGFASLVVDAADRVVLFAAGIPGAAFDVSRPSPIEAIGWTLALASTVAVGRTRRSLLVAGLVVILAGFGSGFRGERFRVDFVDVGQGDATVVESGNEAWLVDGGGPPSGDDPTATTVVSHLRRRGLVRLDAVAATHPQADHEGGLAGVVIGTDVREVWWNGKGSEAKFHAELVETTGRRGVPWRRKSVEATPVGAGIEVLAPDSEGSGGGSNDESLVLRWARGATSVLLPGDVEARGEARLLARGLRGAVIVRAPHHGSRTSSGTAFVGALRPAVVVAGTGFRNRFGLPSPGIPERWRAGGALWFDTASDGEVVVSGDGQLATVETCRADG